MSIQKVQQAQYDFRIAARDAIKSIEANGAASHLGILAISNFIHAAKKLDDEVDKLLDKIK